ncbi:TRAP transporter small permease [Terrarubrum flagellatum]|uniref:TRAP transporter small permease n=1 Tax=Terrirubrum flagellatum TaxID=2895980 RepID=UPI003145529A
MLQRAIGGFDALIKLLTCVSCIGLAVTVMLGVISRAANEPFIWTDEASRFMMIYVATFGWILASRKQLHIRVRFFQDMLPPRLKAFAETIMQAVVTLFGVLLVTFGAELVMRNTDIEATSIPISMSWVYLPIVLGGLVTIGQGVAEFWLALQTALHDRADESAAS